MPTVDEHITQWKHNRRCAQSIGSQFRDWQINIIFYAALHAVDAALMHLKIQVTDHEARNNAVKTNASLASVRIPYLDLYRISKLTRYDADPDNWLPAKYLTVSDLVREVLQPIENEVERLLGRQLKLSPLKVQD
jgi:hypothetical protein